MEKNQIAIIINVSELWLNSIKRLFSPVTASWMNNNHHNNETQINQTKRSGCSLTSDRMHTQAGKYRQTAIISRVPLPESLTQAKINVLCEWTLLFRLNSWALLSSLPSLERVRFIIFFFSLPSSSLCEPDSKNKPCQIAIITNSDRTYLLQMFTAFSQSCKGLFLATILFAFQLSSSPLFCYQFFIQEFLCEKKNKSRCRDGVLVFVMKFKCIDAAATHTAWLGAWIPSKER